MWDAGNVGCWQCGTLAMWDAGNVGRWQCGTLAMWGAGGVACLWDTGGEHAGRGPAAAPPTGPGRVPSILPCLPDLPFGEDLAVVHCDAAVKQVEVAMRGELVRPQHHR